MADSIFKTLLAAVDSAMTKGGNALVRNDLITDVIASMTRMEAITRRRMEHNATWLLHQYYLPSFSDVRRVSAQLAALEARMRDMAERLDELDETRVGGAESTSVQS